MNTHMWSSEQSTYSLTVCSSHNELSIKQTIHPLVYLINRARFCEIQSCVVVNLTQFRMEASSCCMAFIQFPI